jgi:hypothetical protein
VGGGVTLWWPGGPLVPSGQGGRALWTLPTTGLGVGVGRAVGRAVGWAGGTAVGTAGGTAVGVGAVAVGSPAVGRGVGSTATTGPASGGRVDGVVTADGSTGGVTADGAGSPLVAGVTLGVGVVADGAVSDAPGATVGPGLPRAIPSAGRGGATNPAVSATVARMRLRSPMATTRRAR